MTAHHGLGRRSKIQTFLPIPNIQASAEVLDNKRLGKQRVEAWQILRALRNETKGWVNHPATVMWRGHEQGLCLYGYIMSQEWVKRGFQDVMSYRFLDQLNSMNPEMPWWYKNPDFHLAHRSNLIRKDYDFYSKQFDWEITPTDLPYLWPRADGNFYVTDGTKIITKTLENSLDY